MPQLAQAQWAIMVRRRSRSATLWGIRNDRPTGSPVVGSGDGGRPDRITPRQVEDSRKRLDALVIEQGRDPASVSNSVFGQPPDTTREQIEAFLNAGAVRVAVWPTHCETEQGMGEQLERMAAALVR